MRFALDTPQLDQTLLWESLAFLAATKMVLLHALHRYHCGWRSEHFSNMKTLVRSSLVASRAASALDCLISSATFANWFFTLRLVVQRGLPAPRIEFFTQLLQMFFSFTLFRSMLYLDVNRLQPECLRQSYRWSTS